MQSEQEEDEGENCQSQRKGIKRRLPTGEMLSPLKM